MPYKNPEQSRLAQKRWREANPNYHREYWIKNGKKYTKYSSGRQQRYKADINNKVKIKARNAVYYALSTGKLIKPEHCSECGLAKKLEADHRDYSKPLEVQWLCKSCHQWYTTNKPVLY